MNTKELEQKERAIELLKNVLTESDVENEFDQQIYEYLKEIGALPEDYTPYWEQEPTTAEVRKFIEDNYSIPEISEILGYYDGSLGGEEQIELEKLDTLETEKEFEEKLLSLAEINGNFIEACK